MKKLSIIVLYSTLMMGSFGTRSFANDPYLEAMQKNIATVYQSNDIAQLQDAVNAFERIGSAEATRWEPFYYAAFGYIMMANVESDGREKDQLLDRAIKTVEKAKSVAPSESEIASLEGFVYMLRITIDPGSRGPELSPLAIQAFTKAQQLDPENPRALLLSARMKFGTAKFFGNTTVEACQVLAKSLEKFETYRSDNPLAPTWGRLMAQSLHQQCQ